VAVTPGVREWRAPGRTNLIGEHTDYNEGFVMPIAIQLGCRVRTTPLAAPEIRAVSAQLEGEMVWPIEAIPNLRRAGVWGDYVAGVAKELALAGVELKPMRLEINATVPTGSGLSSSAALEVASALALLSGRPMEKIELARLCQRAERNFVGMPCGIMDQYAAVFGQEHAAILLDCRSQTHRLVPLPEGIEIVAVNTMVKHELGSSAYRQRVAECAEALSYFPGKTALRDVSLGDLEIAAPKIREAPLARARHVVLEDWRVEQFLEAATRSDLARMGRLLVESHRSLQHDYEVSCEELDFLVDTALTLPGVYGARMTGGGFGGCTVNLINAAALPEFTAQITARYQGRYGLTPAVYRCVPTAGAGPVP
jgi:galactokinase